MTLSELNLAQWPRRDLLTLQRMLEQELAQRSSTERKAALQQINAICQQVGVPMLALLGMTNLKRSTGPRLGSKVDVRFQHPEKPELKWTGRGRQPIWLRQWLEAGGTMAQVDLREASGNLPTEAQ
jgi:DNA-binding protein H-NS